jgi:anti-sigma regulatory factor (Ser/Thr protein kinase)
MSAEPSAADLVRTGAQQARAAAMMVLGQAFDANTLPLERAVVQAHPVAAGMPENVAADGMIAVHELASNAVVHGAGAGQLHLWRTPGQLWCQVDDDGAADAGHRSGNRGTGGDTALWPYQAGHGLWLAQLVASQMHATSGPAGTRVTLAFALPGATR